MASPWGVGESFDGTDRSEVEVKEFGGGVGVGDAGGISISRFPFSFIVVVMVEVGVRPSPSPASSARLMTIIVEVDGRNDVYGNQMCSLALSYLGLKCNWKYLVHHVYLF